MGCSTAKIFFDGFVFSSEKKRTCPAHHCTPANHCLQGQNVGQLFKQQKISGCQTRNLYRCIPCIPSLKLTAFSHLKRWHPKRKLVFQPSIFRCHVSFREGNNQSQKTKVFCCAPFTDFFRDDASGRCGVMSSPKWNDIFR